MIGPHEAVKGQNGDGGVRIGVDIGGTFSDLVMVDMASGHYRVLKVPSTPENYMLGIKEGLEQVFTEGGPRPAQVSLFFHGTTVATNTVIEKTGARTGLLTTAGFRDVLEVGRTERPGIDLYNLAMERPKPLVPGRNVRASEAADRCSGTRHLPGRCARAARRRGCKRSG